MVQSCLKLKPCVKCGAWVGWDETPNPHCIPSCDAQEERLTPPTGDFGPVLPGRAARIRAFAEDLVRASTSDLLYEPQPTQADLASQRWHLAMLITDLFDQLEAEERAKEADRE